MPNNEPPKYIYLQWNVSDGEVTWSAERISDEDVKYLMVRETVCTFNF